MAVALTVEVSFALLELLNSGTRGGPIRSNILGPTRPVRRRLISGTGVGKVDVGWFRGTGAGASAIAASGNLDIDVAGALTDSFGTPLGAATKLVAVLACNFNTAGTLTLRAASSTSVPLFAGATQPGIIIPAAASADNPSFVLWFADSGLTIAGASTDKLNLLNNDSSNAANYRIAFAARTA